MYQYNRYLYVHFNYKTIEVYILYYNISPKWSSIIFTTGVTHRHSNSDSANGINLGSLSLYTTK